MNNDENSRDPIADAFSLEPLPKHELVIIDAPTEGAESYDMETARQNIHHLIQKGNIALDEMINVAIQSQNARAFEVTANLIKTLADVNKDLIDLQEKKKKLAIKDDELEHGKSPEVVNNTLVVSSNELQDIFEKLSKK